MLCCYVAGLPGRPSPFYRHPGTPGAHPGRLLADGVAGAGPVYHHGDGTGGTGAGGCHGISEGCQ